MDPRKAERHASSMFTKRIPFLPPFLLVVVVVLVVVAAAADGLRARRGGEGEGVAVAAAPALGMSRVRREPAPFSSAEEKNSLGPVHQVVGVLGHRVDLECDVTPTLPNDQLLLVLWYKEGHGSPIYTFDARKKSSPTHASRYSSDEVFGRRATMVVPPGGGVTGPNPAPSEAATARLIIEAIQPGDDGLFKCRTDFKRSPTRNSRIELAILVPPKKPAIYDINGQRMTDKLGPFRIGEDLVAKCVTSGGSPHPRLSWWRGHALLDDSYEVINGETTNTLRVSGGLRRDDLGDVFTCQAVNNNQSIPVSTSLNLDMTFPPKSVHLIRKASSSTSSSPEKPVVGFSAGREERLKCLCRGSRPPPMFYWYIGDRKLNTEGNRMIVETEEVEEEGSNAVEFVTTAIFRYIPSAADHGKFLSCRAVNEHFPARPKEDGYSLDVKYVPEAVLSFGPQLDPNNIKEGDDVYFECHVKSNPPSYNITWRHHGKFVGENVKGGILIGNQTLVLQNVGRDHAGIYTCVASNQEGDGESNAQYLNVKFAPLCRYGQRLVYGTSGIRKAEVACFVDANPNPARFRWQFQGLRSSNSGGGRRSKPVTLDRSLFTVEKDHSILTVDNGGNNNLDFEFGTALCWGENSVGGQREPCRFQIIQESPPEELKKCRAINVTWEDMEISCKPGFDGGHETSFHAEIYEMDENDRSKKNLTANITRSDHPEFEIHNLKPGRIYGVLLYASNLLGPGKTLRLNVTTAEMADKRTAETRTKVAAVGDGSAADKASPASDTSSSSAAATSDRADVNELALLPIITILCGVAVGLATLALGVIFLVRGRSVDEAGVPSSDNEDNNVNGSSVVISPSDVKSVDGGGARRGKYGIVATEDDLIAEKQLCSGDRRGYIGAPQPHHTCMETLPRSQATSTSVRGGSGNRVDGMRSLGRRQPQQQQHQQQFHHPHPHPRSVHFQPTSPTSSSTSSCSSKPVHRQVSSSRDAVRYQQQQHHHHLQSDLQMLDESLPVALMPPPTTFSDSPPTSSTATPIQDTTTTTTTTVTTAPSPRKAGSRRRKRIRGSRQ